MKLIFNKKITIIGSIFLSPLISVSIIACTSTNWITKRIVSITDGDTFITSDNTIYRLIGVDTPESFYFSKPTKGIEAFYASKAKEFTSKFLLNKNALFLEASLDKYNRQVSRVKVNDDDLSFSLLKKGLARVAFISCNPKNLFYYNDYVFIKTLLIIQTYAKNNKIGIWEDIDQFKQIFPKQNITTPNFC